MMRRNGYPNCGGHYVLLKSQLFLKQRLQLPCPAAIQNVRLAPQPHVRHRISTLHVLYDGRNSI